MQPKNVKRIVLTGPESTGKTTLCQQLAAHFKTVWVAEYGREHWETATHTLTVEDISIVAKTQLQREAEAALHANMVLFCDTDLIVTQVWSEIFFGHCPEWIVELNRTHHYDLYLLLAADIPWVHDGTRQHQHLREAHFNRLHSELATRQLPFQIISGDFEARFQKAVEAVKTLIG